MTNKQKEPSQGEVSDDQVATILGYDGHSPSWASIVADRPSQGVFLTKLDLRPIRIF